MPADAFDLKPTPRLVFGAGAARGVGEFARELGGRRVLIISDAGLSAAGHVEAVQHAIAEAGLEAAIYDEVHENPTTLDVDNCVEFAAHLDADLLIGLGGGSSMDTAKGCNFLLTNGGQMQDYWGVGKASKPMLPLIAIPTTAGTGSECQSFALISDPRTHQKMGCGDPKALARIAILDPELTLTQPRGVAAATGLDAVAHAVETAVTRRRNAYSSMYSAQAFALLQHALPVVLNEPGNLQARADMQIGAAMAGMAIEASMLGAAHSAANPLTARFDVTHGVAVFTLLPTVVSFNGERPEVAAEYRKLALTAGLCTPSDSASTAVEKLVVRLNELLARAGLPGSLTAHGVQDDHIADLADMAAEQWTAQFNPREIKAPDFAGLYRSLL